MIKEVLKALGPKSDSFTDYNLRQNLVGESLRFEDFHARVNWSACHDEGNKHVEGVVIDELGAELGKVSIPFKRSHPECWHSATAVFEGFDLEQPLSLTLSSGNLLPFYQRAGLNDDDYTTSRDAPRAHIFL